jgi:hypothetical protein
LPVPVSGDEPGARGATAGSLVDRLHCRRPSDEAGEVGFAGLRAPPEPQPPRQPASSRSIRPWRRSAWQEVAPPRSAARRGRPFAPVAISVVAPIP